MRTKEKRFKELGLAKSDLTRPELIAGLLSAKPVLFQRPVLVSGKRAVMGRPIEKVLARLG